MRSDSEPYLKKDYAIDQAILDQSNKIIILKFNKICNFYDKTFNINFVKFKFKHMKNLNFFSINIEKIREFNLMYELKKNTSLLYFFNNRKIFMDSGTGDTNKICQFTQDSRKIKQITKKTLKNCQKGKNFLKI